MQKKTLSFSTDLRARGTNIAVDAAKTLIPAILIALLVRTFVIEPFNIPSASMVPTLDVGDYMFVWKMSYGLSADSLPFGLSLLPVPGRLFFQRPHRGDVVVFKLPRDNTTDYVKRIIGLPGDRIQVRHGVLYINDAPVQLRRIGGYLFHDHGLAIPAIEYEETLPNGRSHRILQFDYGEGPLENTPVFVVPPGHYFMMGDNRDDSADSRDPSSGVGFVPAQNLEGRAVLIFFSIGGASPGWEFWKWPFEVRYSRLLTGIA